MILDEGIRPDNRKLNEIRPIWCETQAGAESTRLRSFQERTDTGAVCLHAGSCKRVSDH